MKLGKPPRKLTNEQKELIANKSKIPFYAWIASGSGILPGLILVGVWVHLYNIGVRAVGSTWLTILYSALIILFVGGGLAGVFYVLRKSCLTRKKWTNLLKHGTLVKAKIGDIHESFNVTVNQWPMRKIELLFNGRTETITTFDPHLVDYARSHKTLDILVNPDDDSDYGILEQLKPTSAIRWQKVKKK